MKKYLFQIIFLGVVVAAAIGVLVYRAYRSDLFFEKQVTTLTNSI